MFGVLSRVALIVAIVCELLLAGSASAQAPRQRQPVRQASYRQAPEAEEIPAGRVVEQGETEYFEEDNGGFVGGMDDMLNEGPSLFPYGFEALDADAEALIPDGFWNNRGPLWYSSAAVTLLKKSAPGHEATGLPIATSLRLNQTVGVISHVNLMSTSALDTPVTPGLRLTVGRNLYEDIVRRQHSLEFTFLGLNTWDVHSQTNGVPTIRQEGSFQIAPNLWSYFLQNPSNSFVVDATATNPSFIVNGNKFVYDGQSGFNNASEMRIKNTSSFSNLELNYRVSKLPRPDRIAQRPDGNWMQVGTVSLLYSFLGGVRFFTFNDDFHWLGVGAHSDGQQFSGQYDVRATNLLAGAQLGGDVFMNSNIWTMGIRGKAGIYGNAAKQISEVQIIDPAFLSSSGAGKGTSRGAAFIGDLGLVGTARLTERSYFRLSYDFMWVSGLANAAEQLQYTTDIAPVVRHNGFLLFQGVSLGLDFCW